MTDRTEIDARLYRMDQAGLRQPYVMPTIEEIEAMATDDTLKLRDTMRELIGNLYERMERSIWEHALAAQAKGKRLAVSPIVFDDNRAEGDTTRPHVLNVKADTRLLNPDEEPPAGWVIVEARER